MPKLSIIIPVFNRAHCIQRALQSIQNQNFADWELLVGDDASTDDTVATIEAEVPTARVIRLAKNSGAAAARNAALRLATGEYVAFLDSDDEWLPHKIASQVSFLDQYSDYAMVATSHFFQRRNGVQRKVAVANVKNWQSQLHHSLTFHGASTPLIRRSVIDSVGPQDELLRVLEDWDWMLRIAEKHRIHVLPEPLVLIHENGPTNPDFTSAATKRFLAKHQGDMLLVGRKHHDNAVAQHWENAARCFFRHSRNREGCACLWKSLLASPLRNPSLPLAFPLAAIDGLLHTHILGRILSWRAGTTIR